MYSSLGVLIGFVFSANEELKGRKNLKHNSDKKEILTLPTGADRTSKCSYGVRTLKRAADPPQRGVGVGLGKSKIKSLFQDWGFKYLKSFPPLS